MVIKGKLKRLGGCVVGATALFDGDRWLLGGKGKYKREDMLREDVEMKVLKENRNEAYSEIMH